MRKIFHIIFIMIAVGFTSCEEQFFFDEDKDIARQIVISGYINQGRGPYEVRIQQTAISGLPPTPILSACVKLVDQQGNKEEFVGQRDGTYLAFANLVKGFPGRSYHIEVELADGRSYKTRPDRMPTLQATDEITWEETTEITTTNLGVDVEVPVVKCNLKTAFSSLENPIYLTWLGEETYAFFPTDFPDPFNAVPPPCYIVRPIGAEDLSLFTNVGYTKNSVEIPQIITRQIDKSFTIKHIFSIYQFSMSEENFNYMKSIEALAENTGSLFDTPPGVALGNVLPEQEGENVQGFFQAVLMDTTRIAVYPSQLNTFFRDDCKYVDGTFPDDYSQNCRNCSTIPGVTARPDYWVRTN